MKLVTIDNLKRLRGKTVLLRTDYNVVDRGKIIDDFRISASVPTIKYLLKHKCKVIIISHNGRPEGKRVETMSLKPVAQRLATILHHRIRFVGDCVGPKVETAVGQMKNGDVLLLENLRFYKAEEKNDPKFTKALASLADVYVDDAFAAVHRAHASIVGVAELLPHAAGKLVANEYTSLHALLEKPKKPVTAIIGGAKVSDKIEVLENLIKIVDYLAIGGAMANTFLNAQGMIMGSSVMEKGQAKFCLSLLRRAKRAGVEVILPDDIVIARAPQAKIAAKIIPVGQCPHGYMALDLGPKSSDAIIKVINKSKTVFWNGTLGYAELEQFSHASEEVARGLANAKKVKSIIGGGDTASFIDKLDMHESFDFVSTGGGASLELVAGKKLPGIEVLMK